MYTRRKQQALPAGDDVDWSALTDTEVLCLAEKPTRVFLAGEGGTGKTYVVSNMVMNGAYRFFLGKFCEAKPLAFTNRAAGLYGSDAQTVMGYMNLFSLVRTNLNTRSARTN